MEAVGDNPRSSSEAVAPRNRKGFSLVEAAIVLAVVGLVIGGIWYAASAVMENHRVSETSKGILTTCANIAHLFPKTTARASGDSAVDIGQAAIASNVFPDSWIHGNDIMTPVGPIQSWYKPGLVLQWDLDRGDMVPSSVQGNVSFHIFMSSEPQCRKLVGAVAGPLIDIPMSVITSLRVMTFSDSNFSNLTSQHFYLDNEPDVSYSSVQCGKYSILEVFCRTNQY